MVWKDENGNTCFGIKPEPVETVADASDDSESGESKTPRKRKSKEADEKE
jgi:hypothetical protein